MNAGSLASLPKATVKAFLETLSAEEVRFLADWWPFWARPDQLPPHGDWTTWLLLGGRGAGKTRAGAEWVRAQALSGRAGRIAIVGETLSDAREVMVEGASGLRAIGPSCERPSYEAARRRLSWPNGAIGQLFSAADPEGLRGPQFDAAWADELCKWRYADETWDMLQFGLRLGERPRQVVTTTPRGTSLLKRLLKDPQTRVSRAKTYANRAHLAPAFFKSVISTYEGTRLGRQELDAELIEDNPDALWSRAVIELGRVSDAPSLVRIVVAIDPPPSSGEAADECGIVTAGLGQDGRAYVLADHSAGRMKPIEWARRAAKAFERFQADRLVAEVNQGGDMVEAVMRQVLPAAPLRQVRATRGKLVRAEPVAALYEQGRVCHVGMFGALEDQLCDFVPGVSAKSPDRLDALVWALTDLMLDGEAGWPRLRPL